MKHFWSICLVLTAATTLHAQTGSLEIYWTDVEGGASTLIATPAGQSLLVDAGWAGDRDPQRILQTAKAAGIRKIDILITTHYHNDHVGGTPALAKLIPIEKFYDHGESVEIGTAAGAQLYDAYKATADGKRVTAKPGDKLPLRGVEVTLVSADGQVIDEPINGGGPNALCKNAQRKDPDKSENARSIGFLLTYGKFKFLDLGDLTWEKELMLACPVNKLGTVTLFQASHHGFSDGLSGAPAMVWAIKPQVVIVNDGARKGFVGNSYDIIAKIPGLEGIWQLHRSMLGDAPHNTADPMIANLDEGGADHGLGIKVSVAKDGTFTVTNARNDYSKTYMPR